jgi:hypothetical protein
MTVFPKAIKSPRVLLRDLPGAQKEIRLKRKGKRRQIRSHGNDTVQKI